MRPSPFQPIGPAHYRPTEETSEAAGVRRSRVGVFFATREGHTQRIAERITSDLLSLGFDVDLVPLSNPAPFSIEKYSAAILAASVHGGSHENEMVRFVKDHRNELKKIPTAFVSVTLSEAGAERKNTTAAEHARFLLDVNGMLSRFYEETQWTPTITKPVAGALLYTHYNFLLRLIMKHIAKKAGGDTDTSRDFIYTDWNALDQFSREFAAIVPEQNATGEAPHA